MAIVNNNTDADRNLGLPVQQGNDQTQENLLWIILRHRWIVLSAAVVCVITAFTYLLKATPIYTSASRLYVEQTGPKIINDYEGYMTRSNNYLYTQAELMRSTPIISEVANGARIRHLRTFANVDNLIAYLKKNVQVSIGKKDDIITVSFDSPYPEEAAETVNAVVNSYVGYHSTRKRSTVSEVLKILQTEKQKRNKELSKKYAEILEFTQENGIVSFDNEGGNIALKRLSALSGALTEAQLAELNAKADFEAAGSMSDEPAKIREFAAASAGAGVRISINDRETQLKSELRNAELELQNMSYHCTKDHPSNQALCAKIERIKQELNEQTKEFADAYIEVMRLRWVTAKQRQNELQTSFDSQCEAAQDLGVKATEYTILQSELKRAERICDILDDRIKELNVTENTGALNINILEVARAASDPSYPRKARAMAISLALGLMLGAFLAFVRDWMDYRLRSADEISAVLGIPVLGVVPRIAQQRVGLAHGRKVWDGLKNTVSKVGRRAHRTAAGSVSQGRTKSASTRASARERKKPIIGDRSIMARAKAYRSQHSNDMAKTSSIVAGAPYRRNDRTASERQAAIVERGQSVRLKPHSAAAEAYRTIRTAIFFGVQKGKAKTILVSSPAPSDGKSTLVSNLAIAMAQAGQRTLIIDADFRRPIQHKIFEIDNQAGLAGVFAGVVRLDEAIKPGPVEGLGILPGGPEVPNPSEVLNSNAFIETLKSLSGYYDRIIIDSPPVLAVADSQILAAVCDVTVLVLRAEKSTRRLSRQACDSVISVGGHLLGAVMNDVAPKHRRYGYYGGYGGYGYYGDHGYYGSYYGRDDDKATKEKRQEKVHV